MRLDQPARQAMVEQQIPLPVWDRRRDRLGRVQPSAEILDLAAEGAQAGEHGLVAGEIGGEEPPRGLELEAGEPDRLGRPAPDGVEPLFREHVMGALARAPGLLP